MPESSPTIAELFEVKAVTNDDVARLVRAVLESAADRPRSPMATRSISARR